MRKESKWVHAVLFMAVLILATGNNSTIYAKLNTLKTAFISAKELSLTKGQSEALSVKNNRKKVKWASSDKKVASVNGKGKIKALKKGTAIVTVAVGKKHIQRIAANCWMWQWMSRNLISGQLWQLQLKT